MEKFDIIELSELIGIIIGDGNIYYNQKLNKYYFEITGNPSNEKNYYQYISNLIYNLLGKKPTVRIGGRGLRLRVYSKEFVEFLIFDLKLPYGKNKGSTVKIPNYISSKEWNILKYCIRGITDTDGSLFIAKKNKKDYPCIEISTTSKGLAFQLKELLSTHYKIGFRKFRPKNFKEKYTLSINGKQRVNQWIKDIGFSNKIKIKKIS
jgi:hypothetical protein